MWIEHTDARASRGDFSSGCISLWSESGISILEKEREIEEGVERRGHATRASGNAGGGDRSTFARLLSFYCGRGDIVLEVYCQWARRIIVPYCNQYIDARREIT